MPSTQKADGEAATRETPVVEAYVQEFEALESRELGKVPPWLSAQRNAGIAHFAERGFPTTDEEEYRFTNVQVLAKLPVRIPARGAGRTPALSELDRVSLRRWAAAEFVFVDGHYAESLSTANASSLGLRFVPLAKAIRGQDDAALEEHLGHCACVSDRAFCALNTALFLDGAYLYIPRNLVVRGPIHILFVNTGAVTVSPRVLVVAEPHSAVTVVETYASLGAEAAFTNTVTEVSAGEGAIVKHVKLGLENESTHHVGFLHADMGRSARMASHSFAFGGKLIRNDIQLCLNGEGVDALLNGLYLPGQGQTIDHHTIVDHIVPNCESHEFYHGILNGNGRGVFNGKIFVRPGAQKTNAKQSNRALLLSRDAVVYPKPQLEIWADDVKCTHGSTVGELDDNAIFYLRSRGIPAPAAQRILTHAFGSEIVERLTIEELREHVDAILAARLGQWAAGARS